MAGAREITQAAKRDDIRKQRAAADEESGALQARRDLAARRQAQRERNEAATAAQRETDAPENNLTLGTKELRRRELAGQEEQRARNAEAKAAEGAPENKALDGPAENKAADEDEETDPLAGVTFASSPARDAADDAELVAADFKRKRKSSDNGFTKADVERIAANKDADEGEE